MSVVTKEVQCLSLELPPAPRRERERTVLMRVHGEARQNGRIDGCQWNQTHIGGVLAMVPMAGTPRAMASVITTFIEACRYRSLDIKTISVPG
jgi:hypothetical protein